jgi:hypothetical protein
MSVNVFRQVSARIEKVAFLSGRMSAIKLPENADPRLRFAYDTSIRETTRVLDFGHQAIGLQDVDRATAVISFFDAIIPAIEESLQILIQETEKRIVTI